MKAVLVGISVCIATWLTMAAMLGNVGLQRSVAIGPGTLFERPLVIVAVLIVGGAVAAVVTRGLALDGRHVLSAVASTVALDVGGSVVLAPLAVGELDISDWRRVVVVISLFGAQPAAAALGVVIAARRRAT